MRAVILCPGPSLALATSLPRRSILMAINHALDHKLAADADWWVALDLWQWPLPKHAPLCGMVTSSGAIAEGQGSRVPYLLEDFRQCRGARPTATTLPAALWWAAHVGAREVELVGCDMVGDTDFRGVAAGNRTRDRWQLERESCRRIAERAGLELKGLPCPS